MLSRLTVNRRLNPDTRCTQASNPLLPFRLLSCRFKLISCFPFRQHSLCSCFPSQSEAKTRHDGIAAKIHVGSQFIAGLMIMLGGVLIGLLLAPVARVALIFHAFVDR